MRTVTEAVQLARGDERKVFTPGQEVPEDWPIPEEYLFVQAEPAKKASKAKADPAPSPTGDDQ